MNIVDRAKNMIMKPKAEFQMIDGETHTVKDLYLNYIMILAAIPAVAAFIGFSIIGLGGVLSQYRIPIASGIAMMIVKYVLSLASVYVVALIVDALAPNFGSQKNFLQALKLVAFSMTAAWLAGIFSILPALSILGLLGLYSLYVLFLGLPILMKTPEDKVIPYFVVILIAAVVVNVVIGALAALTIPGTLRGF
jgi:hypothetical protein